MLKGSAINGAGSKPWVGVDPNGPIVPLKKKLGGRVIQTGLGDKRNYVEASMCDAAIALPGRKGTVSEVTSCLSLGRPVAFVGNWRTNNDDLENVDLEGSDRSLVLEEIVKTSREKFDNLTSDEGITRLIKDALLLLKPDRLPPHAYFELCEAEATVAWIASVVTESFAGEFPRIAGLENLGDAAREYESWLDDA